jgi:hypothetical protein
MLDKSHKKAETELKKYLHNMEAVQKGLRQFEDLTASEMPRKETPMSDITKIKQAPSLRRKGVTTPQKYNGKYYV